MTRFLDEYHDFYYQVRPEIIIRNYNRIFTMRENETENIFLDVLLGLKAKSNNKPVIGIEKLDEVINQQIFFNNNTFLADVLWLEPY